ncbi:MAG TPA: DUF2269 family protein [Dehalococcoidia bacterium]|nr:DUF2269 family protein [Dehalococcoidia bacterium]
MHDALVTLHVLGAVFLGGTILVDTLTGIQMPRVTTVGELRGLTRLSKVNQYLGVAAAALVALFGYWTAADADTDLDITWLLVAQIVFWVSIAAAVLVLTRAALSLASRVEQLPDGPLPADVSTELNKPLYPVLGTLLAAAYVFVVYLMVAKPDW